MQPASPAQRLRARALVAWLGACAAVAGVQQLEPGGVPPAPCAAPARRDGVLVCDGAGAPARARAWLVGRRLDVNDATRGDLEAIPGVGPSLAAAIIAERDARGRFTSFEELDDVRGVGDKTRARLARWLEVRPLDVQPPAAR